MIHFRVLGTPDLRTGDDNRVLSVLAQPKRVTLLAYLVTEGRSAPIRRERLLSLFWPGSTEDRARNALNQALHVLRRALGADAIVSHEGDLVVVDPGRIECDVVAFEDALDRGEPLQALELYMGEFLDGIAPAENLEIEAWLEGERRRLRDRAVSAAMALTEAGEAAGNLVEAVHRARQAIQWAPHDERALRNLMGLLARSGDRPGALRAYDLFADRLSRDLDDEPVDETRRLAASIRRSVEDAHPRRMVDAPEKHITPFDGAPLPHATGAAERAFLSRKRGTFRAWRRAGIVAATVAGLTTLGWFGAGITRSVDQGTTVSFQRILVAPLRVDRSGTGLERTGQLAADWIAAGLARSGLVEVVGPSEVLRWQLSVASEASSPGLDAIEPDVTELEAREVARRSGAGLLIRGSVDVRGDSILWQARLVEVPTGRLVRVLEIWSAPDEEAREAIDQLAARVAGAVATHLDERFAAWAGSAEPPPSLEAYRHFADGMDLYLAGRFEESAERFRVAARESVFASANLWAAWAELRDFFATGAIHEAKRARADSLLQLLDSRRGGLSPWEAAILDHHRATARFDYAAAHEAINRAVRHVHDLEWLLRAVQLAATLDRPGEVLRSLEAIDPAPEWLGAHETQYWRLRAYALHRLERYGEELEIAERRLSADPADAAAGWMRLRALAGMRDDAGVQEWIRVHARRGGLVHELRAHGYEELARSLIREQLSKLDSLAAERDDEWRYERGLALGGLGRFEEAQAELEQIGPESPLHLDALAELGWVLARLGKRTEAERISGELERIEEADWKLINQARIAASLGNRDHAVKLLRRMTMRGYLHQEVEFEELKGYPPFEELQRPRG